MKQYRSQNQEIKRLQCITWREKAMKFQNPEGKTTMGHFDQTQNLETLCFNPLQLCSNQTKAQTHHNFTLGRFISLFGGALFTPWKWVTFGMAKWLLMCLHAVHNGFQWGLQQQVMVIFSRSHGKVVKPHRDGTKDTNDEAVDDVSVLSIHSTQSTIQAMQGLESVWVFRMLHRQTHTYAPYCFVYLSLCTVWAHSPHYTNRAEQEVPRLTCTPWDLQRSL